MAFMADDEDVIYVDVVARLDEASADEAERKLSDKFKNAAKNAAESIKEATSSLGDNLKDIFSRESFERDFRDLGDNLKGVGRSLKDVLDDDIKDSVRDFGRDLREQVESGNVKSALDNLGTRIKNTTDLVTGLGETLGVHLDGVGGVGSKVADTLSTVGQKVDQVTTALRGFKSGDITGGISGISTALDGLLPTGLQGNIDSVLGVFNNTHKNVQDLIDTKNELKGLLHIGETVGPEAGAAALLMPEALPFAAIAATGGALLAPGGISDILAGEAFKHDLGRTRTGMRVDFPAALGYKVSEGGPSVLPGPAIPVPGAPAGSPLAQQPPGMDLSDRYSMGVAPLDMPDDPKDPMNRGSYSWENQRRLYGLPSGTPAAAPAAPAATGGSSITAQQAVVSAGSAVVTAGSVTLAGGISLPTPQVITVPSAIPAGGQLSAPAGALGAATRGLGLTPSSPRGAFGLPLRGGGGGELPPGFQPPMSGRATGGILPGDSPGYDNLLGQLPGGKPVGLEGGEFVVNPDATQANLGLLQSINAGPHFDEGGQVPQGAVKQDPIGSGKGLGVSGGAIGAAESMASMFPGASIAMQEANLAVQKGGQMLATLAMAPIETMWLGGGQMGAPSVGSPAHAGWMGKLMSGMVGQQTNLPNIAGAVMPPKDQAQKPGEQEPEGVNKAPAPSGTKDDPLHTKNVAHAPGPPQGAPTSAASMNASALVQASPA